MGARAISASASPFWRKPQNQNVVRPVLEQVRCTSRYVGDATNASPATVEKEVGRIEHLDRLSPMIAAIMPRKRTRPSANTG